MSLYCLIKAGVRIDSPVGLPAKSMLSVHLSSSLFYSCLCGLHIVLVCSELTSAVLGIIDSYISCYIVTVLLRYPALLILGVLIYCSSIGLLRVWICSCPCCFTFPLCSYYAHPRLDSFIVATYCIILQDLKLFT